jgi:superkiller protein 3
VLKRQGKIEDAIKAYNKAIEIAPRYPSPYYNLGILYRDTGQRDIAVSFFKKAIEIAPDFVAAKKELNNM